MYAANSPDSAGPGCACRRRGFSLVELFVCFAIIMVLLALLLPAVSATRQAALRVQCSNNLKQIGLALNCYHETFETFPPGYVSRDVSANDPADRESGSGYGWCCLILGFLEQQPLLNTVSFDLDAGDPASARVAGTVISTLLCAADSGSLSQNLNVGGFVVPVASSSYMGVYGYGSLTEQPGAPPGPGVLYRNSHVTAFDITDGSSNTMLVAERARVHNFEPGVAPVEAGGVWFAAFPGAFRRAGVTDHPTVWEGPASLVLGTVGQDTPVSIESPPQQSNFIGGFSSSHGGGLFVLLGDTAVRFLSDQVDYETYRRLAQRNDQQPTGDF